MSAPTRLAWSVQEVADAFGKPAKQIYKLIHGGQLGYFMVGKHYLIPDAELQRLLSEATARGSAGAA